MAGALVCAAALAIAARSDARVGGIPAEGCEGCHGGGKSPTITIDVSPPTPKLGETVNVTVNIPAVNGGPAGLYLRSNGKGALALNDSSTRLIDIGQLVHSSPKAPVAGVVKFTTKLTVPMSAGGVTLDVWGIASNGDRGSKGDGASWVSKSFAVGCEGKTYRRDWDGDGFGGPEITVDCSKPVGYVDNDGDCDDNDKNVHPGAAEVCNMKDDNCNGQVDENLVEQTHYEDKDGDGYGAATGKTAFAKCPPPGFAPLPGDCDENDPKVHPGVIEICNNKDDNCDGRVDERVRPICGVGMCARAAPTCEPDTCEPGLPKPEKCNGLDDNCDGEVDEGDLCPSGQVCYEAGCIPADAVPPPDAGVDGGSPKAGDSGGCSYGASTQTSAIVMMLAACAVLGRRRRSSS